MLGKPDFDCNKLGDFYDCGCAEGHEDEGNGGGEHDASESSKSTEKDEKKSSDNGNEHDVRKNGNLPVEISKEPYVSYFPIILQLVQFANTLLLLGHQNYERLKQSRLEVT